MVAATSKKPMTKLYRGYIKRIRDVWYFRVVDNTGGLKPGRLVEKGEVDNERCARTSIQNIARVHKATLDSITNKTGVRDVPMGGYNPARF